MSTARLVTNPARGVYVVTWSALANGEAGDAADIPLEAATRTIQLAGTFGAGGNVVVEGSNDGINWVGLSNGFVVTPLALTAAALSDIAQNTRFVRPRCTAGDGTTAIKVILVAV